MKTHHNFWFLAGLCWFVYATVYLGRVNLSIALPYLHDHLGYSNASLGMIASGFFVAYAIGQLINGFLGDIINPRYFIGLGLFLAGLTNVFFGFSRNTVFLFLFWTINGYVQSMIWGPLIRIVSESTPQKYLHKVTLIVASSTIFGYLLSYNLTGRILVYLGWQMTFIIPGAVLIVSAGLWLWQLKYYTTAEVSEPELPAAPAHHPSGSMLYFFLRSKLWIVGLLCLLNGSLKEGLTLWGPKFFMEYQLLSFEKVMFLMSFVPFMNFAALVLGNFVNRYFKYQEKYTLMLFLIITVVFMLVLRIFMNRSYGVMDLAFFTSLAVIFAVNNILTVFMPLNFGKERRISTTAGFLDCTVYLGAAISSPLTGVIVDKLGWIGIINACVILCILALVVSYFTINYKKAAYRHT